MWTARRPELRGALHCRKRRVPGVKQDKGWRQQQKEEQHESTHTFHIIIQELKCEGRFPRELPCALNYDSRFEL